MSRVYLLVEGQTEEVFVKELMVPIFSRRGLYLTPIIVATSRRHRGGVVSYSKVKPQIQRLCMHDRRAYVTTIFDLYALPTDFPGKSSQNYPIREIGQKKAAFLEAELSRDIGQENFIPNLLVHEFEALLFAGIDAFAPWTDNNRVLKQLRSVCDATPPEDINDSPHTAPSKRILEAMPSYQKTVHGPLIACDIGLPAIRALCPHFHAWLNKIENL